LLFKIFILAPNLLPLRLCCLRWLHHSPPFPTRSQLQLVPWIRHLPGSPRFSSVYHQGFRFIGYQNINVGTISRVLAEKLEANNSVV